MMDTQARINHAVLGLDAWLDTMRVPNGYGGPVSHWWQNCLYFTGVGLDWRYEGIIIGYLNLYIKTRDRGWLAKACRAGDDLVRGQLGTGNFRNSSFELNPYPGGTPHEAACDLALLELAAILKEEADSAWERYALVAEGNLKAYHLNKLWDERLQGFGNMPGDPTFTANKSATIVEALFALATLRGEQCLIERYAIPTLNTILGHQIRADDHQLDGAIDQNSRAGRRGHRYFPFYNARCVPALLEGYHYTQEERYLDAAERAMSFILRYCQPDGSFPQVVYGNGRLAGYPRWVAGVGDILRAMCLISQEGQSAPSGNSLLWLLSGQEETGALRTAHGFDAQVSQKTPHEIPEFRDLLPVCGWADKAFRYLTSRVVGTLTPMDGHVDTMECACIFHGSTGIYREDAEAMELYIEGRVVYRYQKGKLWAETCIPVRGIK